MTTQPEDRAPDAIPDVEADDTVPPRPEEEEAAALRDAEDEQPARPEDQPVAGGDDRRAPAQGEGAPDSY